MALSFGVPILYLRYGGEPRVILLVLDVVLQATEHQHPHPHQQEQQTQILPARLHCVRYTQQQQDQH